MVRYCLPLLLLASSASGLAQNTSGSRRRAFLHATAAAAFAGIWPPVGAAAQEIKLSDEQLKETVLSDIVNNQFLVTGKITRSIYQPTATFRGTSKLFRADMSRVRLVGDVSVNPNAVKFRFEEDLGWQTMRWRRRHSSKIPAWQTKSSARGTATACRKSDQRSGCG